MNRHSVSAFKGTTTFEGTEEFLLQFVDDDGQEFTVSMPFSIGAEVLGNIEAALTLLDNKGRPTPRPKPLERVIRYNALPSPDEPNEVLLFVQGDRSSEILGRLQQAQARQLSALLTVAADDKPQQAH